MRVKAGGISVPAPGPINLRFFNPLFNSMGSHSFPINFPGRLPSVQKAFGFPSHPGKLENEIVDAEIDFGHLKLSGSWNVSESGQSIEAYFRCGAGDFYSSIGDKLLTSLEYRGDYIPVVSQTIEDILAYLTVQKDKCYPEMDFVAFPVYMPNFLGSDTPEDYQIVNPVEMVDHPSGIPRAQFVWPYNSTVYLFAGAVIHYIFEEHGYKIGRNIFREDSDMCRLVVFNTFNRFPGTEFAKFRYDRLVPRVTIKSFLESLSKIFNIAFIINETAKTVDIVKFDTIIGTAPVDCGNIAAGYTANKKRTNGFHFQFSHPDSWSACPITKIDDLSPTGEIYEVDVFADIVASAGNNNKTYYVLSESAYYRVKADFSTSPTSYVTERISPDLLDYFTGDNEVSVQPAAGTLGLYDYVQQIDYEYTLPGHGTPTEFTTYRHHIIPRCDLVGNQALVPYTDYPLIFLFARGSQTEQIDPEEGCPAEGLYPLGSFDVYDAKGDKITAATMALKWNGDYGLIEQLWKNRMFWEDNIKLAVKGSIAPEFLSKILDYSAPLRIGRMNYLVNSAVVEASSTSMRVTELELFRL